MERKPVMVFISNLRTLSDMVDLYPPEWHERVRQARISPGYIASPPFDIQGEAVGYLVLMLRSGEEVMKDPVSAAKLTLEMTRFSAEDLDGDVIGLGSLTTSITKGGLLVADHIAKHGWKIRATHGDTGSVAAIRDCMDACRIGAGETVGIVGAYGVIGAALSRILACEGRDLILMGRRPDKLQAVADAIARDGGRTPVLTGDLADLRAAHCVITVTSHTSSLLAPALARQGAVIIDPAVPANTSNDPGWRDPAHDNVVVANASQVRVPGVAVTSAMFGTFDDPDGCATTYACMGETMLNAVNRDPEHHVGEIDLAFVAEVRTRFAKAGFHHAIPRMFGTDVRPLLLKRQTP